MGFSTLERNINPRKTEAGHGGMPQCFTGKCGEGTMDHESPFNQPVKISGQRHGADGIMK